MEPEEVIRKLEAIGIGTPIFHVGKEVYRGYATTGYRKEDKDQEVLIRVVEGMVYLYKYYEERELG